MTPKDTLITLSIALLLALAACDPPAEGPTAPFSATPAESAPNGAAEDVSGPTPTPDADPIAAAEPVDPQEAPRTMATLVGPLSGGPVGELIHWDAMAVSPWGDRIAAAFKDASDPTASGLGLWSAADGALVWLSEVPVWSEGCDFHPAGGTIVCAHQPRPAWDYTELLVFDAADGALLVRRSVPAKDAAPQTDAFWGDSARFSPDGRWVAMTQASTDFFEPSAQVLVFAVDPTSGVPLETPAAAFTVVSADEVAFSRDSSDLYASDFVATTVHRWSLTGQQWSVTGSRSVAGGVEAYPAGIDVDGSGRIVVNGWGVGEVGTVLVIDDAATWESAEIMDVPVVGTSYELCADPRPGAHWAWSVSQNGAAQAIDTATGEVLASATIEPVYPDGIAMGCADQTGQPFLVSQGRLWTWQ